MPLFAQFQANNNNPNIDPAILPVLIGVMCVVFVIALAVGIAFLLSMSKALSRCKQRNRTMEPGMVWLNLLPLVNIVWQFLTVIRVSESIKNEFYDRGWDDRGDFGKGLGIAACSLNIAGALPIPILQFVLAIAGLVCFIMYWVKIAGYSKELAGGGGRRRGRSSSDDYDDEEDDDYDDRPKGRGRRRDDYDD